MKHLSIPSTFAIACAMMSAAGVPAQAQDSMLDVVIVTAQKRAQNVQEVPIAVTAFTAQTLIDKGIHDVSQLSNFTPNVTLDAGTPFSGSTSVLAAYIRGIGQNDFAFNFDPGVGVYVDGVYLARTVGANTDLLDVERIEILKGPQGTLFGRNTIGGAINIVTRDPGDEFSFKGEVTGGSFSRLDVRGSADMPFSDRVKGSVSFSSKSKRGYQERIPFPATTTYSTEPYSMFPAAGYETAEREGGQNEWNVRGKLKFEASERLRITLGGDYTMVDQSAMANTVLATTEMVPGPFAGLAANNIPGTALDVVTGSSGFLFAGLYNFCIGATPGEIAARNAGNLCGPRGVAGTPFGLAVGTPLAGVNVDGDPANNRLPYDSRFVLADPDLSYATGNSFSKVRSYGFSATVDFEIADEMSLKSITAYRKLHWRTGMDLDGSPLNFLQTSFDMPQKEWSQELQLTGKAFNDRLDYVVGAYYFDESGHLRDFVTFAEGLLQIDGPNDLWTSTWAVFSHLNYKITDQFSVTLGARYTEEDKKFEGFQHDLNGFNYKLFNAVPINEAARVAVGFPDSNDLLRYFPPGINEKHFTDFSPRIGLEYKPSDNIMVYASYSEGFKSGSWTTRLSNPLPTAPDFDQEDATSYEVGFKSDLFDNRLRLNAAGFYTDYEGIQLNFQVGVSPTFQNAGNAELYGFEVEYQALITEAFTLNGSVGYIHAEYTDLDPNVLGITLASRLPKTPEWKFNVSPRYEVDLGNSGSAVFNVDYTHTSSLFNDTENTPLLFRPATDMLNASITYRAASGNWEIGVGVTNLTDERYLITGQAQVAGGVIYGTYNRPREFFGTVRIRY